MRAQPALLEREAELAELEVALEGARGGAGRLVVIEGAAGIGKTRLLGEARDAAAAAGMRVLTARGTELERGFPFALARQLFESVVRSLDPAQRADALSGAASHAAPVIGIDAPGDPAAPGDSFVTLNALYWLMSNLAESGPVLLAVDDAHWSDEPSLRFFRFLVPRLEDVPVLLAISARPADGDTSSASLGDLLADPAATRIRPRALSGAAVAQVVEAQVGPATDADFCAACHEVSGGNPFMLRELLTELVADGTAGAADEAAHVRDVAPSSIRRAVLVRLARLSDDAHRLARAVAVLGDDVTIADAAALAELSTGCATEEADELAREGILEPVRPLRFVHPLLRTAVHADVPAGVRAVAHARAAALLGERGAEPERIAVHLLATDPAADADVVAVLRAAAVRALDRGAPETAAAYLGRALDEPPPIGDRLDLARMLLRAHFRAGDRKRFDELVDSKAFDDLLAEPRALLATVNELSHLLYIWDRREEGGALLERAAEVAARLGESDRAAYVQVMLAFFRHLPPPAALAKLEEVKGGIEPGSPTETLALASAAQWRLLSGGSRATVIDLARRALDAEPVWRSDSDNPAPRVVTITLRSVDELDAVERAIETQVSAVGTRGWFATIANAWDRGELALLRGDVATAEVFARAATQRALQAHYPLGLPSWRGLFVDVLVERDDLAGAEAALEAIGITGTIPDDWWFWHVLVSRARLRLVQGRPDDALADLLAFERMADANGLRPGFHPVFSYLAMAHHAAGNRAEAARVAKDELAAARAWGMPRRTGIALRTLGLIEGGEAGLDLLHESVEVLAESPARLEHQRSLAEYGAALRRANRRAEARTPLRQALDGALAAGALAVARRAHEELEATGEKLRPLAPEGVNALTPSERRVAEQAARGQTNREVAQELFLSVKTVETHLSSVYRKLGVASRRDLAAALAA